MSSANSESFTSSFPICIPFVSSSSLVAEARTSKTLLKRVVRVDILVLFLILGETLSGSHHWGWYMLCICHVWPLLYWNRFPLCLFSGELLPWIDVEFCQRAFMNLFRWSYCFYCLIVNTMFHIDWFTLLKNLYIPGINHTWSWCMTF